MNENRFMVLAKSSPDQAKALMALADQLVAAKYDLLQKLAALPPCGAAPEPPKAV